MEALNTLAPSIIYLCILIWCATMFATFHYGVSCGKMYLRQHLSLVVGENSKTEWMTLPVRMRGVKIERDASGSDPVTLVLVNVRTKEVRHPGAEFREITRGDYMCGGVSPEEIVLGAPHYDPVSRKPGSVVMLGAEYRNYSYE